MSKILRKLLSEMKGWRGTAANAGAETLVNGDRSVWLFVRQTSPIIAARRRSRAKPKPTSEVTSLVTWDLRDGLLRLI